MEKILSGLILLVPKHPHSVQPLLRQPSDNHLLEGGRGMNEWTSTFFSYRRRFSCARTWWGHDGNEQSGSSHGLNIPPLQSGSRTFSAADSLGLDPGSTTH